MKNKNSPPLVTVVIPSYNYKNYIEETIKSVSSQSYPNIEVFIIDDGSKDGSDKLLKKLQKTYSFELVCQENMGLMKTLNKSLELAKGKYWIYLAADDLMTEERIQKSIEFLENNPNFKLCGGGFQEINQKGKVIRKNLSFYRELNFKDIFLGRKKGINTQTLCYRLDFLKEFGGYDENFGIEDIPLFLKITSKGYKIPVLNTSFVHYRKHDKNWSHSERPIFEELLKIYSQYKNNPNYEQARMRLLKKKFRRATKNDTEFAKEILKEIPWRNRFDFKVIRGLVNLCLK